MAARILIIEDDPVSLDLIAYLFQAFNYDALKASDGEEGVALARRESPDLILCDIYLPKMDGYQVARSLKGDSSLCRIPLVAVTALAMVGDRERVLAAGFDGYIAKPIRPETFVAEVEEFLQPKDRAVRLPVPASAAATAKPAAVPRRADQSTIVVVDASRVDRELIDTILQPLDYGVILTQNAAEGLARAQQCHPAVILSDLQLPGGEGLSFFQAVKADPGLRSIPFVFICSSAWGERDEITAMAQGAEHFISRPIEPETLLAEIAACLRDTEARHGAPPEQGIKSPAS